MAEEQTEKKLDSLAGDVLMLSRNTLLVNLRFLDAALSQFTPQPRRGGTLSTDGQALYYDSRSVLRAYRAEHAAPVRDYLHLVLHCVFRHMYGCDGREPELWDLACDIAVEHTISALGLTAVAVEREKKQQEVIARLGEKTVLLTAKKLYRRLLRDPPAPEEVETMRALFAADDHGLWYGEETPGAESVWKDISRRMQVDMETFARRQGDRAEAMMQNLREANRETCDYAGFLRKLAGKNEPVRTDPEEFDYIFYTYGMSLYDKMPLIEPVEYKESRSVREYVLAVDLSGLISREQAQIFLRTACRAFRAAENEKTAIRLHILTCAGDAPPVHTPISDPDDLERYLDSLTVRKTGETDFRPAFLWTDEMVSRRVFRDLKGLIYFTDSEGVFPAKKPDYETAFVFVNDDYSTPDVPPWVIRLVLQKEELTDEAEQ